MELLVLADSGVVLGLSGIWDSFLNDWLRWIFIGMVAVFAFVFIKDRAWLKLLSFAGIAIVVGVFVFAGDIFFGRDGALTDTATGLAQEIG